MDREVRLLRIVQAGGQMRWVARCCECTLEVHGRIDRATSSCPCGAVVRIVLDAVLWGETRDAAAASRRRHR